MKLRVARDHVKGDEEEHDAAVGEAKSELKELDVFLELRVEESSLKLG